MKLPDDALPLHAQCDDTEFQLSISPVEPHSAQGLLGESVALNSRCPVPSRRVAAASCDACSPLEHESDGELRAAVA
jgi:hypothetical protein